MEDSVRPASITPSPWDEMARYSYDYPRPSVTVDLVLFGLEAGRLRLLLVRRKHDPFAGCWALPGGFMEIDEPFDVAARRELQEETGLKSAASIAFLGVYGAPGRDPRGRTITIAHVAVVPRPLPEVQGADDAEEAAWIEVDSAVSLAFDHDEILADARRWLAVQVQHGPVGLALLPPRFRIEDVGGMLNAVDVDEKPSAWLTDLVGRKLVKKGRRLGEFRIAAIEPVEPTYVVEAARPG